MDREILWLDRLSSWMEKKEDPIFSDSSVAELNEAWREASSESESLLQTSDHLQKAFSQLVGRLEDGQ